MGQRPEIVFIGDDFTGASDTLATLARGGLDARLYLELPQVGKQMDAGSFDAIGIATALRSMPADAITSEAERIAAAIVSLRPRFVHYKVCSTFDSSPHTGSIGAAITGLRRHIRAPLVAIIGGQPSLRRYCIFGTLFAANGRDVFRIDRHPVMSRHPVTPMGEADLRRHLEAQGLDTIGLIDRTLLMQGPEPTQAHMAALRSHGIDVLLFDAVDEGDIASVGELLRRETDAGPLLIVGASSVAEALLASPPSLTPPATITPSKMGGPVFVIAGSRASITGEQVDATTLFEKIALSPAMLVDPINAPALKACIAICANLLREGRHVLAFVEADMAHNYSRLEVAAGTAEFAAQVATFAPLGCLAIAGGDTSSLSVRRLKVESISYMADIDPGVGLCCAHMPGHTLDGVRLVLKGGQMGRADIFDRITRL